MEQLSLFGPFCSIKGCGREILARSLCSMHYQRMRDQSTRADIPDVIYGRLNPCTVDGCSRAVRGLGFCSMHYQRFKKTGCATTPDRRRRARQVCSVPRCGKEAKYSKDTAFCGKHYQRFKKNGTTTAPPKYSLDIDVSYTGAHRRCRLEWGAATDYSCIECGNTAQHWAYDGTDSTQLLGQNKKRLSFYSVWPEFYMPMCAKCHRRRDGLALAKELREFRLLKVAQSA